MLTTGYGVFDFIALTAHIKICSGFLLYKQEQLIKTTSVCSGVSVRSEHNYH